MFYDDCGNKFKTVEEIEDFAKKEFHNLDGYELAEIIEDYFTIVELLLWILKNDKEKFKKDHKNVLEQVEKYYVSDYFLDHDVEEI